LKSLRAANHDFAGSFIFNGLSAFHFAVFSHAVVAVSKADRQPELSEQTGRISLLPIDYAGKFSFTQEIVLAVSLKWARAEGLLIRAFSLPAAKKIRSR
jgi:hypothetical protein